MTPAALVLFTTLFAAAPLATAAAAVDCAPAGMTNIDVTRAGDTALATYRFGAPIACLALGERGDVRKMTWDLQTAGAELSADGNTVRFAAPRTDLNVRLRAFDHDGAIDRVYSPLIAFGDGTAVAVYTRYLYPAMTSGGVFIAFNGFSPIAPERPVGPQRLGIEQTYMIVGQPTVARRGQVAAVIDQAMPAALLVQVNRTMVQGEAALHGVTNATGPFTYLITYTEPAIPDANWRGDTLGHLVRLNFMGAPWQAGAAEHRKMVDDFILHEMFHTASTPALNPDLPGAMSLSEGGAEAGSRDLHRRIDPAANATVTADIDNAIAGCQELPGATLADKERQSQRSAPYVCGMALQYLVAAAVQRDPLDIWHALLTSARPRAAGWPGFLSAAAATGKPDADALAILGAMTASRTDWTTGVQQLTSAGLLRRRTEAELAQPAFARRYRAAAIFHLLKQTCRARHGFNTQAGAYLLDAPPGTSCAAPDKFRLVRMNGIDLARDAYRAYDELARRCAAAVPVVLSDDQGRTIELACNTPAPDVVLVTLDREAGRQVDGVKRIGAEPTK
jgi:hypothetical protein